MTGRRPRPASQARPRRPRPRGLTGLDKLAWDMAERGPGGLEEYFASVLRGLPGPVRAFHDQDSRRNPEGFPDWVVTGRGGILFAELKREGEEPTPAQSGWLVMLAKQERPGLMVRVYRPSDRFSGKIARELVAVSGHGACRA